MLRSGRRIKSAWKRVSLALNLVIKFKRRGNFVRSFRYSTERIANVRKVIVTVNGTTDNGWDKPNSGYKMFISNPVNIKNARLKLTDNKNVLTMFFFSSPIMRRIISPGMNVRYRKPTHCLRMGMFKQIETYSRRCTINTSIAVLLIFDHCAKRQYASSA